MGVYATVETIRTRLDLGMVNETTYPDGLVEIFLKKATMIINGYMRQSILLELVDPEEEEDPSFLQETVTVNAIPTTWGGLHIQLPRRFINEIVDDKISIDVGFTIDPIEILSTQYQLNKELGFIDTFAGSRPDTYFDQPDPVNYQVIVSYSAGFELADLPEDFLEAFFSILEKVKEAYDGSHLTSSPTPSSNKVKEYKTLNETVKYAENKVSDSSGSEVLDTWVEDILNKYRMPDFGMGVRF